MAPLYGRRFSRRGSAPAALDFAAAPSIRMFVHEEPDMDLRRHEPVALNERVCPRDPYAEWLSQRETQRDEERPSIRWVHGQRDAGTPAVVR